MGTTLTGTTPQDTYDSLIKVTDNGPIGATAKLLSDGLGNDSSLALSTTFTAVRGGQQLRLFRTANATYGSIVYLTGTGGFKFDDANGDGYRFAQGANTRLAIGNTGNVGIGTSTPSTKFVVSNGGAGGLEIETSGLLQSYNRSTGAYQPITLDASDILFRPSGTERARITANGLTFNGDTAAANALDDYEEGTWTMGIAFGGASVGVTYSQNTGTYTKIGRQVTVNGFLILTSKGSSTGAAVVTGLPFTIPNSQSNYSAATYWLTNVSSANQFQGNGSINNTVISFDDISLLGTVSSMTNTNFANNSGVIVSFTYFV